MCHVLVIDDSGYFRSASRLALCKAGHLVSFACHGAGIEEMLTRGAFDLLLIGVSLPVADGVDVMAHLRSLGVSIPAIGVGSGVSNTTRARLAALGVAEVIDRFVEPVVLVNAVERATARAASRAA